MCIAISTGGFAQVRPDTSCSLRIDINDTSYTRVVDGVVVPNSTDLNLLWEQLSIIRGDDSLAKLTGSTRPVMLLTTRKYAIDFDLVDTLLNNDQFYQAFMRYPLGASFPIAINGQLIASENRNVRLAGMKLSDITSLTYVGRAESIQKYPGTIFGVIEVTIH